MQSNDQIQELSTESFSLFFWFSLYMIFLY